MIHNDEKDDSTRKETDSKKFMKITSTSSRSFFFFFFFFFFFLFFFSFFFIIIIFFLFFIVIILSLLLLLSFFIIVRLPAHFHLPLDPSCDFPVEPCAPTVTWATLEPRAARHSNISQRKTSLSHHHIPFSSYSIGTSNGGVSKLWTTPNSLEMVNGARKHGLGIHISEFIMFSHTNITYSPACSVVWGNLIFFQCLLMLQKKSCQPDDHTNPNSFIPLQNRSWLFQKKKDIHNSIWFFCNLHKKKQRQEAYHICIYIYITKKKVFPNHRFLLHP